MSAMGRKRSARLRPKRGHTGIAWPTVASGNQNSDVSVGQANARSLRNAWPTSRLQSSNCRFHWETPCKFPAFLAAFSSRAAFARMSDIRSTHSTGVMWDLSMWKSVNADIYSVKLAFLTTTLTVMTSDSALNHPAATWCTSVTVSRVRYGAARITLSLAAPVYAGCPQ